MSLREGVCSYYLQQLGGGVLGEHYRDLVCAVAIEIAGRDRHIEHAITVSDGFLDLGLPVFHVLDDHVALALVRPNAGTIVGATRRGGPHVRWSSGKRRNGWLKLSAFGTIESP